MRLLTFRRLARVLLLAAVLSTTSSCALLGPIIAMPFKILSSALAMFSSNPIGAAAAGAAIF